MALVDHIFVLLVFVISFDCSFMRLDGAAAQNDACNRVTWCGSTAIRFPFHLKEREKHQDHCVFPPGFQLSCIHLYQEFFIPQMEFKYEVNTSHSGLYLSLSTRAWVVSIDYRSQRLLFVSDSQNITENYYSRDIHHNKNSYNLTTKYHFKPFTLIDTPSTYDSQLYGGLQFDTISNYTFYNCSSTRRIVIGPVGFVHSLRRRGYEVYAVYSNLDTMQAPMTSCTKMYNFSAVPYYAGGLTWSGPNCGDCEAKGQYCRFKPNSTSLTECYFPKGQSSYKLLMAGKVGGIFFVLVTLVVLYYATKSYKQKKKHLLKIEVFLEDYKALKPSRYTYANIRKISDNFKVKLGEGGYGSVFKGQLSNDVFVAVKVLNDKVDDKRSGEDFINEVSTIGLIHHVNVVRLVGYCADSCRRALVYEFQPNNSLEKYVYSREIQNKAFLGWEKMNDIALGIAKGIEYLHRGCAQPILHLDIKPHNILLDRNFNPKIADFGLAKLCTKGQSMVSMTMARGTIGYIAPEVFSRNFGKVSSKSDVYSFGMLLLEMVGARDHTSAGTENTSEAYFPEWVFHQLEQGRETRSQIEEEVNNNIAKKLTVVGLWCINWHPGDRPSMKHVIQMLQDEDCPAIPPNPFSSASEKNVSMFSNTLDAISESD